MENNRKFSILNGTSGSISMVEDDSSSILENDSQVESIIDEILSGEHFLQWYQIIMISMIRLNSEKLNFSCEYFSLAIGYFAQIGYLIQ